MLSFSSRLFTWTIYMSDAVVPMLLSNMCCFVMNISEERSLLPI